MSSKLILVYTHWIMSSGPFTLKTYNLATIYFWVVDSNPRKTKSGPKKGSVDRILKKLTMPTVVGNVFREKCNT